MIGYAGSPSGYLNPVAVDKIQHPAYDGTTDFSAGHENSFKTFRFFLVSGGLDINPFTPTIPPTIDGVITASAEHIASFAITAADNVHITGSILGQWDNQIRNQAADFTVAGFTNTIAPSSLFTVNTGSAGYTDVGRNEIEIKGKFFSAVTDISLGTGFSTDTTGSVATTKGSNTYHEEQGALIFDGSEQPFSLMPIKDDGINTTSQST